jgi:hypothetical protein
MPWTPSGWEDLEDMTEEEKKGKNRTFAHSFAIQTGDWSNDGHGKTELFYVGCTHSRQEFQEALKAACRDDDNDLPVSPAMICCDYNQKTLSAKDVARIKTMTGFDFVAHVNAFVPSYEGDVPPADCDEAGNLDIYGSELIVDYLCHFVTFNHPTMKAARVPNDNLNWYDTQPEIGGIAYGVLGDA